MADESLPSEFDAIILGTGLTESIVSAALSRIGKKVLQLDRNRYYGSQWATFSFDEMQEWIKSYQEDQSEDEDASFISADEYDMIPVPCGDKSISNIVVKSFIKNENEPIQEASSVNEDSGVTSTTNEDVMKSDLEAEICKDEQESACELGSNEVKNKTTVNVGDGDEPNKEFVIDHETDKSAPVEPCSNEIFQNYSEETLTINSNDVSDQARNYGFLKMSSDEISKQISDEMTQQISDEMTQQIAGEISHQIADETHHQVSLEVNKDILDSVIPNTDEQEQGVPDARSSVDDTQDAPESGELFAVRIEEPPLANLRVIAQSKIASRSDDISLADLKTLTRKFNLDITPKLYYSRGSLIDILISANICHYLDYLSAKQILTLKENEIVQVPCSRADVFSTDAVSIMEKRILMKFISFCMSYDENPKEYEAFANKPFVEFLMHKKLSKNLQHYVLHAISMVSEDADTLKGLSEAQRFITSIGRYSNSPFLWPSYGTAELPQAFCRMSAVFGGTYCLRRFAKSIKIERDSDKFNGITCTENQEISAKFIVMENSYLPRLYSSVPKSFVSRAVLITNRSLKESTEETVTLLTVPPGNGVKKSVRVIETGPAAMSCPLGLFIVHMTMIGMETAEIDLQPVVDLLFDVEIIPDSQKPRLLWCLFFNQIGRECEPSKKLPSNMFVTKLPGSSLGFEESVQEARQIFDKICPNEEFLPPVPDAEDIVWDDENKQLKQGGRVLEGEDPAEAAEGVIADGNADGGDGENAVAFQENENVAAQEEERGFANDNENVPQDQIDAPAKE